MKYLPLIILLILSASCCRFIPQKCITNTTDTLTMVHVDTLIRWFPDSIEVEVPVPGETVIDSVPYPVQVDPDGLINSDTLFMEVTFARAWAVVENSILRGELVQKDTVIHYQALLDSAIREITIKKDSIVTINNQTTILKKQMAKTKWILISVIIILGLILLIKLIRR